MQTGLSAGDRKIIWAAVATFALLALLTVLTAPSPDSEFAAFPSTYSSAPAGARAALVLLQQLGTPTQRWEEPPFRLNEIARNATLVLAEPSEQPSGGERNALREFVNGGGRVLFCGAALPRFFGGVQLSPVPPSAIPPTQQEERLGATQFSPNVATNTQPTSQGIIQQRVELRPKAFWAMFGPTQMPVFGDHSSAVVAVWKIGKGEVIWWAAATPLTNAGLSWASNLSLFLNSIGAGRQVYWDEYFHGEHSGLWSYIDRTAVRWAVLQLALLACAGMFTFSRRSGPIVPARHISRLSPLEFIQTLGGLYRRSKAGPVAVDISLRELRLQLARRLSLSISASEQEFAVASAERLRWDGPAVQTTFREAQVASTSARIPPRQALALVRTIQELTARLNPIPGKTVQEKH